MEPICLITSETTYYYIYCTRPQIIKKNAVHLSYQRGTAEPLAVRGGKTKAAAQPPASGKRTFDIRTAAAVHMDFSKGLTP